MKKRLFQGVGTALVTPFTPDNTLDVAMLEKLIHFQMEQGADALVLCGTTGESAVLSDAEKRQVIETGVRLGHGKLPVIAGVGSNSTAHTIQLARMAEDLGADGLLVVTPYYNKTTQVGAIQHYTAVAAATALPLLLYNVPSRTGMDLQVDTVCRLAQLQTVVGIKEAGGSMEKIARLRAACPADFAVYAGNDAETLPVLALGGAGVISVASNLLPGVLHRLCTAFWAGEQAETRQIQQKLTPLEQLLFEMVNPLVVKALMRTVQLPCGACRLPLEQLSEQQYQQLLQRARPLLAALGA